MILYKNISINIQCPHTSTTYPNTVILYYNIPGKHNEKTRYETSGFQYFESTQINGNFITKYRK